VLTHASDHLLKARRWRRAMEKAWSQLLCC
jgi:hypothetical protein